MTGLPWYKRFTIRFRCPTGAWGFYVRFYHRKGSLRYNLYALLIDITPSHYSDPVLDGPYRCGRQVAFAWNVPELGGYTWQRWFWCRG